MNSKISFFFFFLVIISCTSEKEDLEQTNNSMLKQTQSYWNDTNLYSVRFVKIENLKPKNALEAFQLESGLLIEEISEKDYHNADIQKNKYVLKDTLVLIKKHKKIQIGKTLLEDKINSNGSFEFYNYLGYFPIMNQYLIKGEYLDSLDYKMIDKSTGTIKQSFINVPLISKSAHIIAVAKTNESEKQTYLEFYTYKNSFYNSVFKAIFTQWRVVDFEKFAFWGNDGSLYLKINNLAFESNLNESFIKITLN